MLYLSLGISLDYENQEVLSRVTCCKTPMSQGGNIMPIEHEMNMIKNFCIFTKYKDKPQNLSKYNQQPYVENKIPFNSPGISLAKQEVLSRAAYCKTPVSQGGTNTLQKP